LSLTPRTTFERSGASKTHVSEPSAGLVVV
jgi:hypothetical protein